MSPATTPASTRWCPTTEQLMILEEMYKSGVRTPNATQIQHITAHLAYYGKIEGKNVFYWFQNHKARDRQKLRRKLINRQQQHLLRHHQQHFHEQPSTTIGIGPGLHQFPHFLHPQHEEAGGEIMLHHVEKQASQVMKKYRWTYDDNVPERLVLVNNHQMMEKSSQSPSPSSTTTTVNMYDRDWLMMMDVMNPPTTFQYPCCNSVNSNTYFNNTNDNNRPILKTLELFPVKSTNLKDECRTTTTSSKQQHLHFLSSATCSSTTTS